MFKVASPFKLIEHDEVFIAEDFIVNSHDMNCEYIELNMASYDHDVAVVALIIQTVIDAQAANIPVILNRTNQKIDNSDIPSHFSIGLLTSGTTGLPKLIFHHLAEILPRNLKKSQSETHWLLCYHPMSFAGLQVILQAIVCQDTLVAAVHADLKKKSKIAVQQSINAISATPSMFRAMLLSWNNVNPPLSLISLGGEVTDQLTLDSIKGSFSTAQIRHIYATTEAGVLFAVKDGQAGFPHSWLNQEFNGWYLKAENTLHLYKGSEVIDTGDCINVTKERVYFIGRKDSVINVGGVKVNLETLEKNIIALPEVNDARVYPKANPITGSLICVELCAVDHAAAKMAVQCFSKSLEPAARPRIITFSSEISLTATGKKQRLIQ